MKLSFPLMETLIAFNILCAFDAFGYIRTGFSASKERHRMLCLLITFHCSTGCSPSCSMFTAGMSCSKENFRQSSSKKCLISGERACHGRIRIPPSCGAAIDTSSMQPSVTCWETNFVHVTSLKNDTVTGVL